MNEQKLDRPSILFVPHYSEILKGFEPFISDLKKDDNVFVYSIHLGSAEDYQHCQQILGRTGVPFELQETFELVDRRGWQESNWYRLLISVGIPVLIELKARREAKRVLDKFQPDIIVTGSEKRVLMRHLIFEARDKSIPSICYSLDLGAPKDLADEHKRRALPKRDGRFQSKLYRGAFRVVRLLNAVLIRLVGLYAATRSSGRFPGGGSATVFAVVSERSREYYEMMGTDPKRIEVLGHPLLQKIHHAGNRKDKRVHPTSGILSRIPSDKKVILWANNDANILYNDLYSLKFMQRSWEEKLDALMRADGDAYILLKLHPKYDLVEDFVELDKLFEQDHRRNPGQRLDDTVRIGYPMKDSKAESEIKGPSPC